MFLSAIGAHLSFLHLFSICYTKNSKTKTYWMDSHHGIIACRETCIIISHTLTSWSSCTGSWCCRFLCITFFRRQCFRSGQTLLFARLAVLVARRDVCTPHIYALFPPTFNKGWEHVGARDSGLFAYQHSPSPFQNPT